MTVPTSDYPFVSLDGRLSTDGEVGQSAFESELLMPEAGKPRVIFLAGSCNSNALVSLAQEAVDLGCTVRIIGTPGFNVSTGSHNDMKFDVTCRYVGNLISSWINEEQKTVVVAHSLACATFQRLLARNPDRQKHLTKQILLHPPFRFHLTIMQRLVSLLVRLRKRKMFADAPGPFSMPLLRALVRMEGLGGSFDVVKKYNKVARKNGTVETDAEKSVPLFHRRWDTRLLAENVRAAVLALDSLPNVHIPTVVYHSDSDPACAELGESILGLFPQLADEDVHLLEKAGHFSFLNPEIHSRIVEEIRKAVCE